MPWVPRSGFMPRISKKAKGRIQQTKQHRRKKTRR